MTKTIAITGATGFIGQHLCHALAAAGHTVVALSRKPPVRQGPTPLVLWQQVADLTDADALCAAVSGCDIIVHLADSPERLQSKDTNPARRAEAICAAAGHAGIPRIIYASSLYARTAKAGPSAAYGALKRANEETFATARDLCPVVLRLPPVYGPGAKGGFAVLAGLVRRGLPVPFGSAQALRDYLSITNLTDLVLTMVDAPHGRWQEHRGKCYEPCDGQAISTVDLIGRIKDATGSSSTVLKVPHAALRLLGTITGKSAAIAAVLEPHLVETAPSLGLDWQWRAPYDMPDTLRYLSD